MGPGRIVSSRSCWRGSSVDVSKLILSAASGTGVDVRLGVMGALLWIPEVDAMGGGDPLHAPGGGDEGGCGWFMPMVGSS